MTAFACALGGAGVTSKVLFGHHLPDRPEDVVTYLATLGAAVIAGWWLANVLAWTLALRRGIQLQRFTLPGTKRIAQILLAVALSTSCATTAGSDPVMVLVEQGGPDTNDTSTPTTTTPMAAASSTLERSTLTAPPVTPVPLPPIDPAPGESLQTEPTPEAFEWLDESDTISTGSSATAITDHDVVINEGDNLWVLASEALTLNGVDDPSCGQIAAYWRLVVAANHVRSGNPDLIVVGETVTMPAFELGA